jgi:hypothetical protein
MILLLLMMMAVVVLLLLVVIVLMTVLVVVVLLLLPVHMCAHLPVQLPVLLPALPAAVPGSQLLLLATPRTDATASGHQPHLTNACQVAAVNQIVAAPAMRQPGCKVLL